MYCQDQTRNLLSSYIVWHNYVTDNLQEIWLQKSQILLFYQKKKTIKKKKKKKKKEEKKSVTVHAELAYVCLV
jgi:hypothetical protein